MSSADNPNPEARKRAEQLERSREWLKRYHAQRQARYHERQRAKAERLAEEAAE
jgi:hypothetical protein